MRHQRLIRRNNEGSVWRATGSSCTTPDWGHVLLQISLLAQHLLHNGLIMPQRAWTCQGSASFRGISAACCKAGGEKAVLVLARRKSWALAAGWGIFFLSYRLGKPFVRRKRKERRTRSHAGGMLGQAARMSQGNGLAMHSGSSCSEQPAQHHQEQQLGHIKAGSPVCAHWQQRQMGDTCREEKAVGGWVVLPSLSMHGSPQQMASPGKGASIQGWKHLSPALIHSS